MHKTNICIFLIILLACLGACQPTPDHALVIAKDQEALIKAAQKNDGKPSSFALQDKYGIPNKYKEKIELAGSNFRCNIDAIVSVPTESALPIMEIKGVDFSTAEVQKIVKALFKGAQVYKARDINQMTRGEIEEWLVKYYKTMKDDAYWKADEDQQVSNMLELYKTAPEKYDKEAWDGQIWKEPFGVNGNMYGEIGAVNLIGDLGKNTKAAFSLMLSPPQTETIMGGGKDVGVSFPAYTGARISFLNINSEDSWIYHAEASRLIDYSIIPLQAKGKLTITPMEAREKAETFLESLDIAQSFQLADIYYCTPRPEENVVGGVYKLYFTRAINHIPLAYINEQISATVGDISDPENKFWNYETAHMIIDHTGIISFNWLSPHQTDTVLVTNSNLLSFDEIAASFKKFIQTKYEAMIKEKINGVGKLDIAIYDIKLGLMRVIKQNSIEEGLLVPAWIFYGTETIQMTEEYINRGSEPRRTIGADAPNPVMIINAVDGSIIDPIKGY